MNQAPIVDFTIDIARSVADQCICHPASRSVDDIERAGEAIKYLLWVIEKTRATAAVEQDRAQRGEPVAWRAWFDKDSGARWLFSLWPDEENKGLEVDWQPLYTAPQPERKPMSDVEAYALAGAVFPYSQHAKCLELIRDVESHHGIKP